MTCSKYLCNGRFFSGIKPLIAITIFLFLKKLLSILDNTLSKNAAGIEINKISLSAIPLSKVENKFILFKSKSTYGKYLKLWLRICIDSKTSGFVIIQLVLSKLSVNTLARAVAMLP